MLIGFLNSLFFIPKVATEKNRDGYVTLYDSFEKFYSYYVYRRVKDCWNRPICSVPGDTLMLKDRITRDNGWTSEFTGRTIKCVNLGSYNYLGFAKNTGPCAETSIKAIEDYGIATCSPRRELGEHRTFSDRWHHIHEQSTRLDHAIEWKLTAVNYVVFFVKFDNNESYLHTYVWRDNGQLFYYLSDLFF